MDHAGERPTLNLLGQHVDMGRHHAPSQKPVADTVEMQKRGFDQGGDLRPRQQSCAEFPRQGARCRFRLFGRFGVPDGGDHRRRKGVGEAKDDVLDGLGRVEMR